MVNIQKSGNDLLNDFLTNAPIELLKQFSEMIKQAADTEQMNEFGYHVSKYLVSRMIWEKIPKDRRTNLEEVADDLESIVQVTLKEGVDEK